MIMIKSRLILNALSMVIVTLAASALAQAQATRTWVSGVGDDANPCSRTAPCRTFAGAIPKTFIAGEIDALDPGSFGAVTITKSITIDGGSGFGAILASGTTGIIVNVASGNPDDPERRVTLRRLSINGTGASGTIGTATGLRGLNVLRVAKLYVENCYIQNFTTAGIEVDLNDTGPLVSIKDTNISHTNTGIQMTGGGEVVGGTLDRVRVENCANGIIAKEGAFLTIRDSIVVNNATTAVGIENTAKSAGLNLENTLISNAGTGVAAGGPGTRVDLSNTSILYNFTAISSGGGTVTSHGNNRIANNSSPGVTPTLIGEQ
jgi:hypothetical protein